MPRHIVAIFTVCLSLLSATPALAQYMLEPEKGYTEQSLPGLSLQYTKEKIMQRFPAEQPEFLVWDGGLMCRMTFPTGDGQDAYKDDVTFMLAGQTRESLGFHGDSDNNKVSYAIYGLVGSRIEIYGHNPHGEPYLLQTVEFPSLSAEYVWLVDLSGNGHNELVVSGMTGISNGGGAFVFRILPDGQLETVTEDFGDEIWPQQLWSFYGSMELLRTPEGKWVFQGITPVGRNLSDYFWSYFYEWDETLGRFTTDGPSFAAEKQQQREFFQLLGPVLQDFQAHPGMYYIDDPQLDFHYGFVRDRQYYSLECYLGDEQEPDSYLIEETLGELRYLLNPQEYD